MKRLASLLDAFAGARVFKPLVFLGCLGPAAWIGYRAYLAFVQGDALALGVEPVTTMLHETGQAALILLLVTLGITPARRLLKINRLQRVRRMLGVWSFTYALLHLSIYLVFDRNCYSLGACQFSEVWADVIKRKFIFVGMAAFSILLMLAITSTNGWVRRLKKNWQRLHRLVYAAAVLAIVHFIWIQKSNFREPLQYAAVLAVLLGIRVWLSIQKQRARAFTAKIAKDTKQTPSLQR